MFLQQIKDMEEQIQRFNKNYFVLKDYMEDARDKLQSMCQKTARVYWYYDFYIIAI